MFPALYEAQHLLLNAQNHSVFSASDLKIATEVRQHTKPKDVLVGAPNHNSPLVLTGRSLYFGYEGTLHSHGIDYRARRYIMQDLQSLSQCSTRALLASDLLPCPNYLLWTEAEYQRKGSPWRGQALPKGVRATSLEYLYEIPLGTP
jgi:hypothetical protein